MLRFLRYFLEAIAALVGVAVVLSLLVVWRLSAQPVSSDFLTPYIEAGIESILPSSQVHLGATLLTWSRAEQAVSVHADNIVIDDIAGGEIATIPAFDAKISVLGMLVGQFMPKDLSIDHPQIKLRHTKDGAFTFGAMAMGNKPEPQDVAAPSLVVVTRNALDHLIHTALMHRLAVTRAVVDVHDEATGQDWSVSIPEISIARALLSERDHRLEYGALDGRASVAVTQKDAQATMDFHYSYDPARQEHSLSSVFADLTPAFFAGGHPETLGLGVASMIDVPLTGTIKLVFDKYLAINDVDAQIHAGEGDIVYPDFWDHPCPIKSMDMHARYDHTTRQLSISDTHIDFQGTTLDAQLDGMASTQQGQDQDFTATIDVAAMPMNRFDALWPKPIVPDARDWLVANLRDGVFKHANVTLKGSFAFKDLGNLAVTDGSGKVSAVGGRVTYLDGLPSVEGVNAEASFDLKKMLVQVNNGGIGAIKMSPFTIEISGLSDVDQYIDIPLQVSGPVPDILRLLDHQPLGYAKALGITPDDISGRAEGSVHFRFPLLKSLLMKDVDLHASANATAVASTKLIPGLAIDQGNLAMTLDMAGFAFKGAVALDKVPFQVAWQENFEQSPGKPLRHATVTGSIKENQWANFGIDIFNGSKGSAAVALDMTKPAKNKMVLSGVLDMGAAAVNVAQMGWKKEAGSPANLKFSANAVEGKPVVVSSIVLQGGQVKAVGDAVVSSDMSQLLSLNLSPLVIGRTNASIHFAQSFGANGALRMEATGASLDVSGLRGGKDPEVTDPRPKEYHVQVGRLYTGGIGEIDQAQGTASRDTEGWREINLHGLAEGDSPLSIELLPQPDGHRTFSIAADDFGKAMKGLGFTDTIHGGRVSVNGQSTIDNPRMVTGTAKIGDFTVEKLPVLALLMNATSPFGFAGILTDSTDFSRFQGDFKWQGDVLTLTRAHAAGSAMGINVDGKVDMNSGDANLQGTLVPFSVMNKIINYLPVIGDLITGGENQGVLAVTYQIKGNLDSPHISVNPVSLLTPGFIRNLFFSDDAEDMKP